MRLVLSIAILLAPALGDAQEPSPAGRATPAMPAHLSPAPRAWLGLEVTKPDETITAHLPDLPPGFGFVVRSVEKNGPAEQGGLKALDVLWKFGDQMLVNESQLACLLRLAEPGEEITLSCFRSGRPIEIRVKLGDAGERKRQFPETLLEEAILPGATTGPLRLTDVNLANKSASFASDKGKAEVRKEGDVYMVKIVGPAAESIYEGPFPADGEDAGIPDDWRRRIHALRRGLDHALQGGMTPGRAPRPRVLQPAPAAR